MSDPAFSLPVAIAIAVAGGATTFWVLWRAIQDQRRARGFRTAALARADDSAKPALEALFATERAFAVLCGKLVGQDWVVGQRLIHAAEVLVFEGLADPADTKQTIDKAITLVESNDFEAAWELLNRRHQSLILIRE
ncbi:MAG: hypothetical protein R3E66_06515 [bacterium]